MSIFQWRWRSNCGWEKQSTNLALVTSGRYEFRFLTYFVDPESNESGTIEWCLTRKLRVNSAATKLTSWKKVVVWSRLWLGWWLRGCFPACWHRVRNCTTLAFNHTSSIDFTLSFVSILLLPKHHRNPTHLELE